MFDTYYPPINSRNVKFAFPQKKLTNTDVNNNPGAKNTIWKIVTHLRSISILEIDLQVSIETNMVANRRNNHPAKMSFFYLVSHKFLFNVFSYCY